MRFRPCSRVLSGPPRDRRPGWAAYPHLEDKETGLGEVKHMPGLTQLGTGRRRVQSGCAESTVPDTNKQDNIEMDGRGRASLGSIRGSEESLSEEVVCELRSE